MPSTGFDIGVASTIVKRIYDERDTVSQMQDQAPYFMSRKKIPAELGEGFYASIQTQRNQSLGIRNTGSGNDNEALPSVSNPAFQNPTWQTVRKYARIYASGKALSRTTSKDRSFASGIAYQVMDIRKAHTRDQEFSLFNGSTGTGNKSGCRGILDDTGYTAGSSVTFTLDFTTNVTARRYKQLQGIFPGMTLDVYDSGSWSAVVAKIVVSDVDVSTGTIVGSLSENLSATANKWYLFREGDFNRDIYGLLDIVDDGAATSALAGVTTEKLWKGHILGNSGTLRPLSVSLLDEAVLISQQENDRDVSEVWANYQTYKQLLALHQRAILLQKPMGSSPIVANLGGEIQTWDNATVKKSKMVPSNTMFVLQADDIVLLEQEAYRPLVFGQENGREVYWRFVPGFDNWEAVFVHEYQQKCHRRNLHVQLADIDSVNFV